MSVKFRLTSIYGGRECERIELMVGFRVPKKRAYITRDICWVLAKFYFDRVYLQIEHA